MCNNCECAFEYLCSIRGYMAYGSCCEKCTIYEGNRSSSPCQMEFPKVEPKSADVINTFFKKSIKLKLYP